MSDIKTLIKTLISFVFSLLIINGFLKRPPSIVLPCGRLRELILVSDQLWIRTLFRIFEVVAYESFDCSYHVATTLFIYYDIHSDSW